MQSGYSDADLITWNKTACHKVKHCKDQTDPQKYPQAYEQPYFHSVYHWGDISHQNLPTLFNAQSLL